MEAQVIGAKAFFRHGVEAAFFVEQTIGGEYVEVWVEGEVVVKGGWFSTRSNFGVSKT